MTIFVVMEGTENPAFGNRLATTYGNNFLKVGTGQWLVSDSGNAQSVSFRLGLVPNSGFTSTLVFATSSYYGLHTSQVWDWIKSKLESAS